jgi:hypothetical protein
MRLARTRLAAGLPPPVASAPGACKIKFNLAGIKANILEFAPDAPFAEVDRKLREANPELEGAVLRYEPALSRKVVAAEDMEKSLAELGITGRVLINVTRS